MKKNNSQKLLYKQLSICFIICFCIYKPIKAQHSNEDDVIVLKDGKQYVGQIIEQSPGKSIKFIDNATTDTLTFFIPQIDKLKKQAKKENKQVNDKPVSPIEININTNGNTNNNGNPGQLQIGNDLTVFSDMGYKFAIYINGKRYNEEFATNVMVENINHDWVQIGVLFEDPDKGLIERSIPLSPYNGELIAYSSTYKIAVNKKNKLVLSYYGTDAKKLTPGTSNIIIHKNIAPPPGLQFQMNHSTRISR